MFCEDKRETVRDILLAEELLEASRRGKTQCFCCEEWFAEDGIWFHMWDSTDGEVNVCPDCWLDFIWDNYITGCSFKTFKELLKKALKD